MHEFRSQSERPRAGDRLAPLPSGRAFRAKSRISVRPRTPTRHQLLTNWNLINASNFEMNKMHNNDKNEGQ